MFILIHWKLALIGNLIGYLDCFIQMSMIQFNESHCNHERSQGIAQEWMEILRIRLQINIEYKRIIKLNLYRLPPKTLSSSYTPALYRIERRFLLTEEATCCALKIEALIFWAFLASS